MAMTVVLSLLIYILLFVNEAIADYDVCFRGGWRVSEIREIDVLSHGD